MNERTKGKNLIPICEIIIFSALIFVRLFGPTETVNWIVLINWISLFFSFAFLLFDLVGEHISSGKFHTMIGVFLVVLIALLILIALVYVDIIHSQEKTDDIVLLVTLLISLPSKFYKEKIIYFCKR